jgi:hypothetical protein
VIGAVHGERTEDRGTGRNGYTPEVDTRAEEARRAVPGTSRAPSSTTSPSTSSCGDMRREEVGGAFRKAAQVIRAPVDCDRSSHSAADPHFQILHCGRDSARPCGSSSLGMVSGASPWRREVRPPRYSAMMAAAR